MALSANSTADFAPSRRSLLKGCKRAICRRPTSVKPDKSKDRWIIEPSTSLILYEITQRPVGGLKPKGARHRRVMKDSPAVSEPNADMKHTANVSVSSTHKQGGVCNDNTRSLQAIGNPQILPTGLVGDQHAGVGCSRRKSAAARS